MMCALPGKFEVPCPDRRSNRKRRRRPTALPLVAPLRRAAKHALRRRTYAAASVGVSRSPVSRLVSRGVRRWADRVLIADALRTASGRVLVLTLITRLRRRDDRKGRPPPRARATGRDASTVRVGSHRGDPALRADGMTPAGACREWPNPKPADDRRGGERVRGSCPSREGDEPEAHSSGARPGGR
jgi:hypothetical protein